MQGSSENLPRFELFDLKVLVAMSAHTMITFIDNNSSIKKREYRFARQVLKISVMCCLAITGNSALLTQFLSFSLQFEELHFMYRFLTENEHQQKKLLEGTLGRDNFWFFW